MITIILHIRVFCLEVVGCTLVLIGDGGARRKIVSGLGLVQAQAESHIRIIQIIALGKGHSGDACDVRRGIACGGTGEDDIVTAILAFAIGKGRSTVIAGIGISIPFATGKGVIVSIFKVVNVIGCARGLRRARNARRAGCDARRRSCCIAASGIGCRKAGENVGVHPPSCRFRNSSRLRLW